MRTSPIRRITYRCLHTLFVDREDYEEIHIIICPLPCCNHRWCKLCQQTVLPGGPVHSCTALQQTQERSRTNCCFCLEPNNEDDVVRLDPCAHQFCRTCVNVILNQRLTPILCPICATVWERRGPVAAFVRRIQRPFRVFTRLYRRKLRLEPEAEPALQCPQ